MIISRWRSWASHALVPFLSTCTQSAPFSTVAAPVAGFENDVIQGKLLPSVKCEFFSRFPPGGGGSTAPSGFSAEGVPPCAVQPTTSGQPTAASIASAKYERTVDICFIGFP